MGRLRVVPSPPAPRALAHTSRRGVTFYLHEGKTKSGKPRYWFAKAVGEGAIEHIPEGFELTESVNGIVSVRRADPSGPRVPASDLAAVQAVLARHSHLRFHIATTDRGAIIVHEPEGGSFLGEASATLGSVFGARARRNLEERAERGRRAPVLKFEMQGPGVYQARRMTYRGDGGWSWPLAQGSAAELARKLIPHLGRESFFELV